MRRAIATIAVLASIWTIAVWLLAGLVLSVGPLCISSTDAARPRTDRAIGDDLLASIHAGSLRDYAGRATVGFDILDPDWLDRRLSG